jgi:hypothetical protein
MKKADTDVSRNLARVRVSGKRYLKYERAFEKLCLLDLPYFIRGGYNQKTRYYTLSGTSVLKKRYLHVK